jgi:hypothetical protein
MAFEFLPGMTFVYEHLVNYRTKYFKKYRLLGCDAAWLLLELNFGRMYCHHLSGKN